MASAAEAPAPAPAPAAPAPAAPAPAPGSAPAPAAGADGSPAPGEAPAAAGAAPAAAAPAGEGGEPPAPPPPPPPAVPPPTPSDVLGVPQRSLLLVGDPADVRSFVSASTGRGALPADQPLLHRCRRSTGGPIDLTMWVRNDQQKPLVGEPARPHCVVAVFDADSDASLTALTSTWKDQILASQVPVLMVGCLPKSLPKKGDEEKEKEKEEKKEEGEGDKDKAEEKEKEGEKAKEVQPKAAVEAAALLKATSIHFIRLAPGGGGRDTLGDAASAASDWNAAMEAAPTWTEETKQEQEDAVTERLAFLQYVAEEAQSGLVELTGVMVRGGETTRRTLEEEQQEREAAVIAQRSDIKIKKREEWRKKPAVYQYRDEKKVKHNEPPEGWDPDGDDKQEGFKGWKRVIVKGGYFVNTKTGDTLPRGKTPDGYDKDADAWKRMDGKMIQRGSRTARDAEEVAAAEARNEVIGKWKGDAEAEHNKKAEALKHAKEELFAEVNKMETRLGEIRALDEANSKEDRAQLIQKLQDTLRMQEQEHDRRHSDEVDHEIQMSQLRHEHELRQQEREEASTKIRPETFHSTIAENRRLRQQMCEAYDQSKELRSAIRKLQAEGSGVEQTSLMQFESAIASKEQEIERERAKQLRGREGLVRLRNRKSQISNDILVLRGQQAVVLREMDEWAREEAHLKQMLHEVCDRIEQQKVPAKAFLDKQREAARRKAREGPLLLDEADEREWRRHQRHGGVSARTVERDVCRQLCAEHERLVLQHRFSGNAVKKAESEVQGSLLSISSHSDIFRHVSVARAEARREALVVLHEHRIALDEVLDARRKIVLRLRAVEHSLAERLEQADEELRVAEAHTYALWQHVPAPAAGVARRRLDSLRQQRYNCADQIKLAVRRRQGIQRSLRGLLKRLRRTEKDAVSVEKDAASDGKKAERLLQEAEALLGTAQEVGMSNPAPASAPLPAPPAAPPTEVEQKQGRRVPKQQPQHSQPSQSFSRQSTQSRPRHSDPRNKYDHLVESLRTSFAAEASKHRRPQIRDPREDGWNRSW
eukprot:Hpha_TRINITY_DN15231_c1_g22::TRINITY_DN15231_c1_g22_i1::g.67689::m.67689